MYTLLSGFWKYLWRKDEYFVLILGLDNAGKTTFLETTKSKLKKNFKINNLNKITATVGLNIGKVNINGITLNFWDLGGQEELQSLWDKYYAETHAVVYIIDAADKDRILESKNTFGTPLLLLANKQDIPDCVNTLEIRTLFIDSTHLIGQRDCMIIPICALNGDGVDKGIKWIVRCIKKNKEFRPPHNKCDI